MVERLEGEVGTGLGTGSKLAHHVDTLVANLERLSLASVAPGIICTPKDNPQQRHPCMV